MKKPLIAALLMGFLLLAPRLAAEENHAPQTAENPSALFAGKYLLLQVDRSNSLETKTETALLWDAKLLELGGRFFLVGTSVERPDDEENRESWHAETTGISWSRIAKFRALSEEQFEEYKTIWIRNSEE